MAITCNSQTNKIDEMHMPTDNGYNTSCQSTETNSAETCNTNQKRNIYVDSHMASTFSSCDRTEHPKHIYHIYLNIFVQCISGGGS